MRKLIMALLILLCFSASATDYYFSVASGNDAGLGTIGSPFKTLAKAQTLAVTGNKLYFQRGETFVGNLTMQGSGTNGNPIVISAYGTGQLPIFTSSSLISAWTNTGSNIWQSTSAVSTLSNCKLLSVNGVNTAMGRTPDTGWWTVLSTNGTTTITDATHLNAATTNWTGATVVIRELMYVINTSLITGASGSTITFNAASPAANFGYFIEGDLRTLNVQNEWFYNTSTKKISIYSTTDPVSLNVQIPTLDNGIIMNGKNFVTIDNINVTGYNSTGILFNGVSGQQANVIIQNSSVNQCGGDGIYAYPNSTNLKILSNTVTDCNNRGIDAGSSQSDIITGNTVRRIGIFAGLMGNSDDAATGIISNADNGYVALNDVQYCGYCCYRLDGNSILVEKNFGAYGIINKNDGGIFYWFPAVNGNVPQTYLTRTFRDNTALNFADDGLGAPFGSQSAGAYFDGQTPNINVYHNTIGNINTISSGRYGLFINGGHNIVLDSNIIYNCFYPYYTTKIGGAQYSNSLNHTQLVIAFNNNNGNCGNDKYSADFLPDSITMPPTWQADHNVYANLFNQTAGWIYRDFNGAGTSCATLVQWRVLSGQDANSTTSPKIVNSLDSVLFLTNPTAGSVTTALGQNYIDMTNNAFAGSITLAPYSGAVLIRNGGIANTPPVCSAGTTPVSITLPVSTAALTGTGASTMGGTIVSYTWFQTSGSTVSITNASTANATATGFASAGTYIFRLTVVDNNGLSCQSFKTVTVNAAISLPPVVSVAPSSQSITLPTNIVSLTSTSTTPQGTIKARSWVQTSGGACTITSPTGANTFISNLLTPGIRTFKFCATNTDDLTTCDSLTVTVFTAIVPTAVCAPNITLLLPQNFCTLSGIGTGALPISYQWTKISGSSTFTLVTPTATSTQFTGLVASTYQVEYKVTDANGNIAKDTQTVQVNAPVVNQPPVVQCAPNFNASLPISTLTLSGTVVVPSGTLSSLQWNQISGTSCTITTPNSLVTTISNITTAGTYSFELVATSSIPLVGRDTITIVVSSTTQGTGIKYFNAVYQQINKAKLTWTTTPPTSNSIYFEVQRLVRNGFTPIAEITPVQNVTNYAYTYPNLPAAGYSFRVVPIDKVGTTIPSSVITVKKK